MFSASRISAIIVWKSKKPSAATAKPLRLLTQNKTASGVHSRLLFIAIRTALNAAAFFQHAVGFKALSPLSLGNIAKHALAFAAVNLVAFYEL